MTWHGELLSIIQAVALQSHLPENFTVNNWFTLNRTGKSVTSSPVKNN